MKVRRLLVFGFLVLAVHAGAQYTKEFRRIFFDADYLYMTGFYEEALNRYKNLLRLDPENDNLKFRCGSCCLKIQGKEMEAIPYLAEAAENVSLSYDNNTERETSAPVITWFMLGRAYHMDSKFELAKKFYAKYIESSVNEDATQVEYAALQLEACARAEQLVGKPAGFVFQSVLDRFDADLPSCSNPVVSGDGSVLIFLVDFPSDKKIMMTTKEGDYFKEPRAINSEIRMVGETYPSSLSYDGTELYLVHEYYSHSDILVSRYVNGRWTEAELLNHHINKRSSETHASISKDGNRLYFSSDRRGGEGSFDIYVSEMRPGKGWGPAKNLGPAINTPLEELTPFISSNDSILFFSSQGHASLGGHDVFFSELGEDGKWKKPENVGYPVSTTGEDLFFNPGWDDLKGYYAVRKASDPGTNTINMVMEIESEMQAEIIETVGPVEVEIIAGKLKRVTSGTPDASDVQPLLADDQPAVSYVQPDISEKHVEPTGTGADTGPETGAQPISTRTEQTTTTEPQISAAPQRDPGSADRVPVPRDQLYRATRPQTPETDRMVPVPDGVHERAELTPEPVFVYRDREVPAGASLVPVLPDIYEAGIPFDYNKFNLNLSAIVEVERIAELMQKHPFTRIRLTGRADARGPSDYNLLLSWQRADGVARYLVQKGIHPERITISGKGESEPLARNRNPDGSDAPAGRFINRQVTAVITGFEGDSRVYNSVFVPVSLKPAPNDPHEPLNPAPFDPHEPLNPSGKYTIQVGAYRGPADLSRYSGLDHVNKHAGADGYHRYTFGEYNTFPEARQALNELQQMGYVGAFIQRVSWYDSLMR